MIQLHCVYIIIIIIIIYIKKKNIKKKKKVLVNGPYGVIKHAQSLIAVISAGRLATVQ